MGMSTSRDASRCYYPGPWRRRFNSSINRASVQPAFNNKLLNADLDGAVFSVDQSRVAFTTDSYVVQPCFFPGGDIGSMAVHGTINDLGMCGARPLYLSAGFVLEEGFRW